MLKPIQLWSKSLRTPADGLFVGAFAMGAATLINSAVVVNTVWDFGGTAFLYALWGFWWADLAVSVLTNFGMLYSMSAAFHITHSRWPC